MGIKIKIDKIRVPVPIQKKELVFLVISAFGSRETSIFLSESLDNGLSVISILVVFFLHLDLGTCNFGLQPFRDYKLGMYISYIIKS
jgi:hypothetical protein